MTTKIENKFKRIKDGDIRSLKYSCFYGNNEKKGDLMFIFIMSLCEPEDEALMEETKGSKLSEVSHFQSSDITVSEAERTLLEDEFTPRDTEGHPPMRLMTQRNTAIP